MPTDKFSEFLEFVNTNAAEKQRLSEAKNPDEVLSIAKELGFEISSEDLSLHLSEVSSKELEGVFGGWGMSSNCDESYPGTQSWCCSEGLPTGAIIDP